MVQVNHGDTENETETFDEVFGVVIRELGFPTETVRVMLTRIDKVPNTYTLAASSGSDLDRTAVVNACTTFRVPSLRGVYESFIANACSYRRRYFI